jgi:hypothetical protein
MRIVSKFKDYYDVGMGLGYDSSITYIRETKVIEEGWARSRYRSRHYDPYCLSLVRIGFCGKEYCAYWLQKCIDGVDHESFCYDIDDVDKFVNQYWPSKERDFYYEERRSYRRGKLFQLRRSYKEDLAKYNEKQLHTKIFQEHNVPIFVASGNGRIETNCLLRKYQFYKVFDAYSAYQEISMYVGGVLKAPVNPVPEVPDEIMRDIKGFDKWSFRKEPQEK